jgi:serine phosphatase RsbU (regulator of sigma subunit)
MDGHLRIEVQDAHPERALPLRSPVAGPADEGGRGLLITSTLAPTWGVVYTRTAKTVWCSFALTTAPDAADGNDTAAPPPAPGEMPAAGTPSSTVSSQVLREETLNRLGLDDALRLATERVRDELGADAAYLMIARDFDLTYEVRAVSGLPDSLRRTRWDASVPGLPNARNPHLPVQIDDLASTPVPFLAGTRLRSLVTVPVTVDGRVTGALGAASERSGGFSDDEAARLQRVADSMGAAAERARLQVSERERRGWLSFVAEAGDLLAGSLDQRMTMAIVGQIVVPQLARWCAIYLDDERGAPVLHHVWHQDERMLGPLRETLDRTPPDLLTGTEHPAAAGVLVGVPLIARGQRIGELLLGREPTETISAEIRLVTDSVVRRAALAIDNSRAHGDLQSVGEALQRSLLPPSIPEVPFLDVGVVYEPAGAGATVGGDFYDLFGVGGGRWCFVVGDVCGTGAEAAAVTGLARHTIRALAMAGFPVAEVLERLNTAILDEGDRSRFLTLACGTLEQAPGGIVMTLVCAGHPPPFLVPRDGPVRQLGRPQALLGVLPDAGYVADEHLLTRGDLLVTVTDGVLERRDGTRMLEEGGLAAALETARTLPAQAVADRVRAVVQQFAATPQLDDMAVLAIRLGVA